MPHHEAVFLAAHAAPWLRAAADATQHAAVAVAAAADAAAELQVGLADARVAVATVATNDSPSLWAVDTHAVNADLPVAATVAEVVRDLRALDHTWRRQKASI